jgi:hypothetical protein
MAYYESEKPPCPEREHMRCAIEQAKLSEPDKGRRTSPILMNRSPLRVIARTVHFGTSSFSACYWTVINFESVPSLIVWLHCKWVTLLVTASLAY